MREIIPTKKQTAFGDTMGQMAEITTEIPNTLEPLACCQPIKIDNQVDKYTWINKIQNVSKVILLMSLLVGIFLPLNIPVSLVNIFLLGF